MRSFALALVLAGCGYHAVHGGAAAPERLAVVLASSNLTDAVAADEVVAGLREELADRGALAPGRGYPRVEVEVLRADEASEGIDAVRAQVDGPLLPSARALRVGLVARAWVVRTPGGAKERDTGDLAAQGTVAAATEARGALFQGVDALRAEGRRAGHGLGRRVLGGVAAGE